MPLESGAETHREYDINGWPEIKDNPLSKVGVFPYSGETVGGEPGRVYNVYRPEEELSDPETIASFKLLPFVDDHPDVLLGGSSEGFTPAEKKGIEGIIGEEVYYSDGILRGNIKILSETLAKLVESGKKQLSVGYRCTYELVSGVWNGIHYDAIQRQIRGNHLALVDQGRMGKEVAVLDHLKYTFDSLEIKKGFKMPEENKEEKNEIKAKDEIEEGAEKKEIGMKEVHDFIKENAPMFHAIKKMMGGEGEGKDDEEGMTEGEEAYDGVKPSVKGLDEEEKEKKDKESKGMDAAMDAKLEVFKKTVFAEVSKRNALAEKLSHDIGTFDHADKTLAEVATYGVKKLGLSCPKGSEAIALDAYYHNRIVNKTGYGLDSASTANNAGMDEKLANFLNTNSI